MDITLLSQLFTYVVFGWIGYLWGKRFAAPTKTVQWVLWLIILVLADKILQMQLVNIFGFIIDSGSVLQALVAGIVINFVFRVSRLETQQAGSSGTAKS
jgi:hypothetical protein